MRPGSTARQIDASPISRSRKIQAARRPPIEIFST